MPIQIIAVFLQTDFIGEIPERYACLVVGNVRVFKEYKKCIMVHAYSVDCWFSYSKVISHNPQLRKVFRATLCFCISCSRHGMVIKSLYIMNQYVEKYIERRKREIAEENESVRKEKISKIANKIQIGEREFRKDFPDEPEFDFPYVDYSQNQCYRYNIGELSDEEYEELLKYIPDAKKAESNEKKGMTGWYIFAIVMLVLSCIGGCVAGIALASWSTAIGAVLTSLIFFSQIILLCKIEYNTRNK